MLVMAASVASSLLGSTGAVLTPGVRALPVGSVTAQAAYLTCNDLDLNLSVGLGWGLELGIAKQLWLRADEPFTFTPLVAYAKCSFAGLYRKLSGIAFNSYVFVPMSEYQDLWALFSLTFGGSWKGWELSYGVGIDTVDPFENFHVFINLTRPLWTDRFGRGVWMSLEIANYQYPMLVHGLAGRGVVNLDIKVLPVKWFILHLLGIDLADSTRCFGIAAQLMLSFK